MHLLPPVCIPSPASSGTPSPAIYVAPHASWGSGSTTYMLVDKHNGDILALLGELIEGALDRAVLCLLVDDQVVLLAVGRVGDVLGQCVRLWRKTGQDRSGACVRVCVCVLRSVMMAGQAWKWKVCLHRPPRGGSPSPSPTSTPSHQHDRTLTSLSTQRSRQLPALQPRLDLMPQAAYLIANHCQKLPILILRLR